MRLEQYESTTNKSQTTFSFISEGRKGKILKKVRYTKVKGYKNLYNLAFGDVKNKSGGIDDRVVTDNQDREKILATVACTVTLFINRHPKAFIVFRGSTEVRNRLYQMAISKYFDELSETFDIKGAIDKKWLPYEKNINYSAFLISLKKLNYEKNSIY
jgi:hypothetical protein